MPAIDESPPNLEAIDSNVARFLWQAGGGPNLPLAKVGPPAVDPQGNVWVPDASYDQFLIFAPDGEFREAWGSPGSGEGQFDFSAASSFWGYGAAAFDTAGNIYVVDTGNHRIQKFGPDRSFITAWGSEGSRAGQFRRPSAIVVDEQGRVYVADNGWGTIQVFTDEGSWLATWSGLGTPDGLAIGRANGNPLDNWGAIAIWVADDGSAVIEFSADGERLSTWHWYGTGAGQFLIPVGVAVDNEGRIYVADMDAERVQVFASDGTFLGGWGESGTEPGQFLAPRGIALDGSGGIYVTEQGGRRIQKFRLVPPIAPQ
jgi:DNA-binding beta-propeller fold protein YncE